MTHNSGIVIWQQVSKPSIDGLDGNIGKQLLEELNDAVDMKGTIIVNTYGTIIHPKNYNTPFRLGSLSSLTPIKN